MSILKNFLRGQSRRNLQELQALEDAIHGLGRLGVPVGKYSRIFISLCCRCRPTRLRNCSCVNGTSWRWAAAI